MDKYLEYDIHSGRESKGDKNAWQTSYVHDSQPRKRGGLKEGEGGEAGVIVSPPHHKTVPAKLSIFEI